MSVYEPREDSFLLRDVALLRCRGSVLDMGTGSGVIGLSLFRKGCNVLAADVNSEAVKAASSLGLDAVQSDLFENVSAKFDWVVFNPPYLLPDDKHEDTSLDGGGEKGRDVLDRFLRGAKQYLNPNGHVLFLQSSLNDFDGTNRFLSELGYDFEVVADINLFFEKLIVIDAWVKK